MKINDRIKRVINKYYGHEVPSKLLLYNMVVLCGIIMAMASVVIAVTFDYSSKAVALIIMGQLMLVGLFFTANMRKQSYLVCAILIEVLITMVLFPMMFFMNGGVYGGMTCWYIIGVLFSFLLLDGLSCVCTVTLQLVVYGITYIVAYYHPGVVNYFDSVLDIFLDVGQSMVVVMFLLGAVIKYQNYLARIERDKNIKQQEKLEEALEQARVGSRTKSEFLANMSHEIRTPINAVIGMGEMILRESDSEQITEYASIIKDSGNMLLNIINDILDFSKVESGKMELTETQFSMTDAIRDLENMIKPRMQKKKLAFKLDIAPDLYENIIGDEMRLKQVINNLLTNAVKYTETGTVTLTMNRSDIDGKPFLYVSVKDTGIGIKKNDFGKLFTSFQRVDVEKNRNIEGTGLGLAISQSFVKLMKGNIFVESEYGIGSNFYFIIPLKLADNELVGEYTASSKKRKNVRKKYEPSFTAPEARVLVVDDNSTNLMVFSSLMKDTKIQIDLAGGGQECLDMVKENKYDIIFLDHLMPVMDGIETLRYLKIKSGTMGVKCPVIALTANAVGNARERYIEEGFDECCFKPVKSEELEQIMCKYLPKEKLIMAADKKAAVSDKGVKAEPESTNDSETGTGEKYFKSIYLAFLKKNYDEYIEQMKNLKDELGNDSEAERLREQAEELITQAEAHQYNEDSIKDFLEAYREYCKK